MNIKKFLAFILSILIFSSFSLVAFAEDETTTEDPNADLYAQLHDSFVDAGLVDSGNYTASNGYSYEYMVPNLEAMMDSAHKYDYVYDFADLLTDEEEAELSAKAASESATFGIAINFLTYDDAYDKTEVVFTDDFYDYYITQLDFSNEADGILFAIDMDNRQVYINTVGIAIDNISDYEIETILDSTSSYATAQNYYKFFVETLNYTIYAYSNSDDSVIDDYVGPSYSISQKLVPSTGSLIAACALTVIVLVILFAVHNKSNKAPAAQTYQTNFNVVNRNAVFMGHRQEVIHGYYKQQSSGGGGGGGSSHSSGGGGSHGGGGHGF